MNNLLSQKQDQIIKQNAADFYALCVYSKHILGLDSIRIKDFTAHRQYNKKYSDNLSSLGTSKLLLSSSLSILLMYTFKSILIVPIFFGNYYILRQLGVLGTTNHESEMSSTTKFCFFCSSDSRVEKVNERYNSYYKLIEYVFNRAQIKTLDQFERELDKLMVEFKI